MEAKRASILGIALAGLTATSFCVWYIETPRDAWTPFAFPIDFRSKRTIGAEFRPTRNAAHLVVLDLGCPIPSSEDVLLAPEASTLPFSWRVLRAGKIEAEGHLGSTRRTFRDPRVNRDCGQEVGRFQAMVGQAYEVQLDVGTVPALDSCNPRIVVGLHPEAVVLDVVIASLARMAGAVLGIASALCFGIALVKRLRRGVRGRYHPLG